MSRTFIKVYTQSTSFDASKATGSDGIPARALKIVAPHISQVVTWHLFNESFNQGTYPTFWKTAKVTPVFNDGKRSECDNYRPFSVLPYISKIHESFMNLELQTYAKEADLIEPHQFAFVKNSSTTTALFRTVDSWKLAIDTGERVIYAFLDLRKS